MKSDFKLMIGALGVTLLLIVGLATVFGGKEKEDVNVAGVQVDGVVANPDYYDLGQVPINGGIVNRKYEIKNTSGGSLKLKKIATSCMCTQASFEIGETKTKFFGMEGHGDKNPPINIEILGGETAKVVVQFDPAAHGPQGVGPFDRIVWLTFSDPAGVKELKFSGTVIN